MKTIIKFRTIILLCLISLASGLTWEWFRRNNQPPVEWQPTEMFSDDLRRFDSYNRLLYAEEQKKLPASERSTLITSEAVVTTKGQQ